MCSACEGDYENPEPLKDEPEPQEPERVAEDAALRVARSSWKNTKALMDAMGVKP